MQTLKYRPFEHDDWGMIRNEDGRVFATVRRPCSEGELAEHRANGTDPFEELALKLIAAFTRPAAPVFLTTEDGECNGNENWEGPLTDEEQGLIDAAWETHKAAKPAPVEGLETVSHMAKTRTGWIITPSYSGQPVVTRSQAEAIIAAERNRAEVAEYKLDQAVNTVQPMIIQRAERAEADNASLTGRVKELGGDRDSWRRVAEKLAGEKQALETQLAAARMALQKIAGDTYDDSAEKLARAALEVRP